MEIVEIKASERTEIGKAAAKKIRNQGLVPAILYGMGKDVRHLNLGKNDIDRCLHTESGKHVIFNIDFENTKIAAMIKEIDAHPVTGLVRHIDFLNIDMDKDIEIEIDVKLKGTAPGVKEGGVMEQRVKKLKVRCLPKEVPTHYVVDVSEMHIADILRIGDINAKDEVREITYPNAEKIVCRVNKGRA